MIDNLKVTFENFNKQISKKEVIAKTRSDNFNKFANLGFPNKKLEDWKFSNFTEIISKEFKNINVDLKNQNKFQFNDYIQEFEHNKIIFITTFKNIVNY